MHGNLPALQAVMDDVRAQQVEKVWFLGDLVGYGADPDGCAAVARESFDVCLAGNHDLGVLGHIDISDFSHHAAAAARWTRENADPATLDFLAQLQSGTESEPVGLYHASPRDPVWEYVLSGVQAAECMDFMAPRVGAIGHTHVALRFTRHGDDMAGETVSGGAEMDLSEGDWLINPGSVGQPRDGDPRAAWLLLDVDSWSAQWRRVEYPISDAAAAIQNAGLPTALGERLYLGQ